VSLAKLVIGNWKMEGSWAALWELADLAQRERPACEAAVCVTFPLLAAAQSVLQATPLRWGAQDCSAHADGPHTGEVSAQMIARFGARYVIVGHSERRAGGGETDSLVVDKLRRVLAAGMTPILCIGETSAERDGNQTQAVLRRQLLHPMRSFGRTLSGVVIAYEPVWAIGNGDTAAPGMISDTLGFISQTLSFHAGLPAKSVRILYGGSVNPRNAGAILSCPRVDGVLVGAASRRPADYIDICRAAARCASEGKLLVDG
jgi:triosephosphate isomerase (TIM)